MQALLPFAITPLLLGAGAGPLPPVQLAKIYTIASHDEAQAGSGRAGWSEVLQHFLASIAASPREVLQHFLASIAASPREALEVRVLRFNASSPTLLRAVGGDVPLEAWSHSLYFEDSKRRGALDRPRWLAWHVAMFFKALSWARVAREPSNVGRAVVCADADHTFFPGWRKVVEACLERHELCFEANFQRAGTKEELRQANIILPAHTPNKTFWRRGWVNTGLFAMRCGPAAQDFWGMVVRFMRLLFSRHGMASDQTTTNAILKDEDCKVNWGLLDPYAVNQASPFLWDASEAVGRKGLRTHARRMLDELRVHHAAYLGAGCGPGGAASACKLRLMRRANATWHRGGGGRGEAGQGPFPT